MADGASGAVVDYDVTFKIVSIELNNEFKAENSVEDLSVCLRFAEKTIEINSEEKFDDVSDESDQSDINCPESSMQSDKSCEEVCMKIRDESFERFTGRSLSPKSNKSGSRKTVTHQNHDESIDCDFASSRKTLVSNRKSEKSLRKSRALSQKSIKSHKNLSSISDCEIMEASEKSSVANRSRKSQKRQSEKSIDRKSRAESLACDEKMSLKPSKHSSKHSSIQNRARVSERKSKSGDMRAQTRNDLLCPSPNRQRSLGRTSSIPNKSENKKSKNLQRSTERKSRLQKDLATQSLPRSCFTTDESGSSIKASEKASICTETSKATGKSSMKTKSSGKSSTCTETLSKASGKASGKASICTETPSKASGKASGKASIYTETSRKASEKASTCTEAFKKASEKSSVRSASSKRASERSATCTEASKSTSRKSIATTGSSKTSRKVSQSSRKASQRISSKDRVPTYSEDELFCPETDALSRRQTSMPQSDLISRGTTSKHSLKSGVSFPASQNTEASRKSIKSYQSSKSNRKSGSANIFGSVTERFSATPACMCDKLGKHCIKYEVCKGFNIIGECSREN